MVNNNAWKKIASKLTYCHGTDIKHDKDIRKKGLLPRKTEEGLRESGYVGGAEESKHTDSVYLGLYNHFLGSEVCEDAAETASKELTDAVVYKIKLSPEDFDRFISDEDIIEEKKYYNYRKAFEKDMKRGGCISDEMLSAMNQALINGEITYKEYRNPPDWFIELACSKRFAIKGKIEPDKIIGALRFKPPYSWK